jgi:hypothetical protein
MAGAVFWTSSMLLRPAESAWPAWLAASVLTSTTRSGRTFGSGFFASRPAPPL